MCKKYTDTSSPLILPKDELSWLSRLAMDTMENFLDVVEFCRENN